MAYTVLTQDEQDDILIQFMQAQERDHFAHTINEARYTQMLKTLPDGAFKDSTNEPARLGHRPSFYRKNVLLGGPHPS